METKTWKRSGGLPKNRVFKVCLTMPDGATEGDAIEYIYNAVLCYRGSLPTENPMSKLDRESVDVKRRDPKRE